MGVTHLSIFFFITGKAQLATTYRLGNVWMYELKHLYPAGQVVSPFPLICISGGVSMGTSFPHCHHITRICELH